jgi:hypothetical protein
VALALDLAYRAIGKIKESDALKWTKGAWEWNKKQGEKNVAWVEKAALDTRDWVGHAAEDVCTRNYLLLYQDLDLVYHQ